MPFCPNCRTYISNGATVCPKCGTKNPKYNGAAARAPSAPPQPQKSAVAKLWEIEDHTTEFDLSDIGSSRGFAALSYFGPLLLIPLVFARKSAFAMFHMCQGLLNFAFSLGWSILWILLTIVNSNFLNFLFLFVGMPGALFFVVFSVIGIVNVVKRKAGTLPLYGHIDLFHAMFKNF